MKITEDGNIIGQIVNDSADDEILNDSGDLDMEKFRPIAFEPANRGEYKEQDVECNLSILFCVYCQNQHKPL